MVGGYDKNHCNTRHRCIEMLREAVEDSTSNKFRIRFIVLESWLKLSDHCDPFISSSIVSITQGPVPLHFHRKASAAHTNDSSSFSDPSSIFSDFSNFYASASSPDLLVLLTLGLVQCHPQRALTPSARHHFFNVLNEVSVHSVGRCATARAHQTNLEGFSILTNNELSTFTSDIKRLGQNSTKVVSALHIFCLDIQVYTPYSIYIMWSYKILSSLTRTFSFVGTAPPTTQ